MKKSAIIAAVMVGGAFGTCILLAILGLALEGLGVIQAGPTATPSNSQRHAQEATPTPSPSARPNSPSPPGKVKPESKPKGSSPHPRKPPRRLYAVLAVIDGDTVEIGYHGSETIRVIGIDTPETVSPGTPDECWGAAASDAARRLLTGRSVSLVFDPSQGRRDHYGRLLAYVDLPGVGDFGEVMIERGHAAEYTYDTAYARQATYLDAEARAKAAKRGLWGKCGGPDVPLTQPKPTNKAPFLGPQRGNCAPGYDPCVPPYPPDVDCADVNGPIYVTGRDPHGLDADGDGVGCE